MVALLLSLLAMTDEEEALARFKRDYASPNPAERAAAVKSLGETKGEKILKTLADFLVRDESPVRVEAAKSLGGFADWAAKATHALVAGLNSNKDEQVQIAVLGSLGTLAQESAAATVNKWMEVKGRFVAKAAVEAAATIRSRTSIEPLIDLLLELEKQGRLSRSTGGQAGGPALPGSARNDSNREAQERVKTVQPAVRKALPSITGEKWTTGKEWDTWWKRNRGTFKIDK